MGQVRATEGPGTMRMSMASRTGASAMSTSGMKPAADSKSVKSVTRPMGATLPVSPLLYTPALLACVPALIAFGEHHKVQPVNITISEV